MPYIKQVVQAEIRILAIDETRLVEGPAIEQCFREIIEAVDKCEESCVALHFGRVSFMSSAALGALVRVHKKCKEYKIDLKLCNIARDIRQVFKITGLERVFDIQNDVTDAIAAFKKSGQMFYRKKGPTRYDVKEE